jgi:ketosteroid isomerase-like protein
MTIAVARPSGHTSHAQNWLIAAVVVLAGALVALGVWTLVHGGSASVSPAAPAQALTGAKMDALIASRQDALNRGDRAKLASFFAADAVFWDYNTNTRLAGARAIANGLIDLSATWGFKYRADGWPIAVGDRFVVVPFSLVKPKDVTKKTGSAQMVEVLELENGVIVTDSSYGVF